MNVTKLFARPTGGIALTQIRNATSRVSRTSAELLQNVANFCVALRDLGVRPTDRVLILCSSRVEAVEAILAAFNVGATAVPVTPMLGVTNILTVIANMRPKCCIFEDPPDEAIQRALADCHCAMVALKASDAAAPHWRRYRNLIEGGSAALEFEQFTHEHPALVIHSSGSSGRLKAVWMSHGVLLRFFEYHELVHSQYSDGPDTLEATSAVVTGLPLSHLAGLSTCLQGLMSGRRTFLMSFFLPDLYLKLVEEARCSMIMLVPSLYRSLLKEPYLKTMDRSALRFCVTGGEACSAELGAQIQAAFGVPLATAYSMTECLSGIAHLRSDLFAGRTRLGSCGKPFFGETKLCDPQGREQPSSGELWVRNATVHACYSDPELNASRLVEGWFRTGDLFHKDADGNFFHRGRVDDMFICNGKNLYPLEIEQLLMKHPAIETACAAPVTTRHKGIVPAALLVAAGPVSEGEIQQFAMRNGPSHAVPQVLRLVAALPQLGPGKVDRQRATQILQQACEEASI